MQGRHKLLWTAKPTFTATGGIFALHFNYCIIVTLVNHTVESCCPLTKLAVDASSFCWLN